MKSKTNSARAANYPKPGVAPQRLLNTREVAELTGLAPSTLEKRRLAGQKPHFIKLGPRRVGYDPADIQAWIEEQRRSSTSDDGTA